MPQSHRPTSSVPGRRVRQPAVAGKFYPADPDDLGRRLARALTGDELVLVKASRGVRLEKAIPHILPAT